MSLQDIVNVTISRNTASVSQAGFGVPAIISEFLEATTTPAFTERIRFYTDPATMLTDGFLSTSLEYLAALAIVAQNPRVVRFAIGRKLTGADGSETWTAALNTIQLENSDWYGFIITERTQADQEEVATWAETAVKIFGISSDDSGIPAATTTDIAAYLDTNSLSRSFVIYHPDADGTVADPWADAAWLGERFPSDPGSSTWMFKTLAGVASYELTDTQRTNILGKNANIYTVIAGVAITQNGTTGEGEYIDVIRFIDWLTSEIETNVYSILVNSEKVPFTDAGAAAVEAEVKKALADGIASGGLTDNPAPTTSVPLVADVSAADKAARLLPDVEFTAVLAGAIHSTTISGIITV